MTKTSNLYSYITNDQDNFFNTVCESLMFTESMSSADNYDELNIIESVLNDDLTQTTVQTLLEQTDEDRHKIFELEQQLRNVETTSPQPTLNHSFDPISEDLLNPRDVNLIDMDLNPMSGALASVNTRPESFQKSTIQSPVSPITHSFVNLSLNIIRSETLLDTPFVSSSVEPTTHLLTDPSIISPQRVRYDSTGAYNPDGTPVISMGAHFIDSSQPITVCRSNRGGHSALPYLRSHTDPLPAFDSLFGSTTGSFDQQSCGESNSMSLSANSSRVERWNSEPVLPRVRYPEYTRASGSHRGRPFSRHGSRRTQTPREKQELLENQLTAHEITNYELNHRVHSLLSATQYIKEQLIRHLIDKGYSRSQIDTMLTRSSQNREGPN